MTSKREIHAVNYEWEETEAWLICANTNMLFRYEFLKSKYELIAPLPENGIEYYNFHSRCVKYKMKVFCLPNRGSDIYIFDISEKKFRKIPLISMDKNRINLDKLEVKGHILYTISYGMKQIIIIDLEAEKIINKYSITDCDCTLYKAIKCGDIIYVISEKNSILWQCDIKLSVSKQINLLKDSGIDEAGFTTIICIGGQLWLSGYSNKIYIFNIETEILVKYIELPKDIRFYDFTNNGIIYKDKDKCDFYFNDCTVFDDRVWFIPYQTNKILYVKAEDKSIRELYIDGEEETVCSLNRVSKRKYDIVKKDKDQLILISYNKNCYYIIDATDQTIKTKSVNVLYSNLEKIWQEYGINRTVFSERVAIDSIMYSYEIEHKTAQNKQNELMLTGSKIYSCISGI